MKLKAVIFDFDGTILDTETPDYLAWKKIFERYNLELDLARWCSVVGTDFRPETFDPIHEIQTRSTPHVTRDKLKNQHRVLFHEMLENSLLIPGVLDTIEYCNNNNIRLALASSSKRTWIENHLERYNLKDSFEFVLTADDVEKIKPAPDLYLKALNCLKISACEAIAIEDSANGFMAANQAGLRTIVVPNSITKHLCFNGAYLCVESLHSIDWQTLQN